MCYKSHLRFPRGNSLRAPWSGQGCCRSCNPGEPGKRPVSERKTHKMKVKNNRTYSLHARLNAEEKARVEALMEIGGYTSFSVYIRDIILQKRLPYRQETAHVSDRQLSDKINVLVYQVNKIGINYNQVVATWQKQSHQTRPDGSPYMNTRVIEARLTELMRMTEGLRDEFAVILDVVKKYIGESPDTSTI